jgi:hypothetical protein
MIVDTIRKTHLQGISDDSLGMLISTIELVAEHVPVARDLLTTNWMSDKSRPVKTKQVT